MLAKTLLLLLGASIASCEYKVHTPLEHQHSEEFERRAAAAPNDNMIYVHLIPHTHDDIGWLKTVDEYYSGTNTHATMADVSAILDNTIFELLMNPERRFTIVEMKFFSMWFYRQDATLQEQVRGLAREGRIEFVNAGWSMHDEANTHYEDQINNMMIGHEFLMKEFGIRPHIGW